MDQQPPWPLTAAFGAIIGYLLPYALRSVIWFARRFTKHYLEGDWFEYHMTFRGHQSTVSSERWLIGRGFWSDLSVTITSFPMPDIRYKGTVTEERSSIVVRLKASTHTEQVTCRLQSPIPLNADKAVGFWLAVDFDGRITAGSEVISRTALKEEEVRRLFSTGIETEPGTGLMRLSA
jgi:hypothetical protein